MSKVLIDTSAWINFFKHPNSSQADIIKNLLLEDKAATCGLVITEVLQGATSKKDFLKLESSFSLLECIEPSLQDYRLAADLSFNIRKRGLTIKTVDVIIASLSIKAAYPLLHNDKHFNIIKKHSPLETFPGSLLS